MSSRLLNNPLEVKNAMRSFSIAILAAILTLGAVAADGLGDIAAIVENTGASGVLNVYHWWTAGGEKEAIEAAL